MSYPLVSGMVPLGALPTAPACARVHVRDTLDEWDMSGLVDVAELLTSELFTNAVEASTDEHGHPVYVNGLMAIVVFRMLAYQRGLVLEVWDLVPTPATLRQADLYDESGRGLSLVDALATRWHWKIVPDWPGKCVWAELAG
jgi:anti-sigma regulatory factor (Ser/Thr protein kinase)